MSITICILCAFVLQRNGLLRNAELLVIGYFCSVWISLSVNTTH